MKKTKNNLLFALTLFFSIQAQAQIPIKPTGTTAPVAKSARTVPAAYASGIKVNYVRGYDVLAAA